MIHHMIEKSSYQLVGINTALFSPFSNSIILQRFEGLLIENIGIFMVYRVSQKKSRRFAVY